MAVQDVVVAASVGDALLHRHRIVGGVLDAAQRRNLLFTEFQEIEHVDVDVRRARNVVIVKRSAGGRRRDDLVERHQLLGPRRGQETGTHRRNRIGADLFGMARQVDGGRITRAAYMHHHFELIFIGHPRLGHRLALVGGHQQSLAGGAVDEYARQPLLLEMLHIAVQRRQVHLPVRFHRGHRSGYQPFDLFACHFLSIRLFV